jgi:hypothetical protein
MEPAGSEIPAEEMARIAPLLDSLHAALEPLFADLPPGLEPAPVYNAAPETEE